MLNTNTKILFILFFSASLAIAQVAQKDTLSEKKPQSTVNQLAELRDQLDDFFGDQSFNNAFWGVMVKSLKTGEVIYRRNADKLFTPASNMKLFTSAAAFLILGANYKYQTSFFANGEFLRGTLKGDLVIQGSGDPTFSNLFFSGSATKVFEDWADTLKAKGIYEITGDIFGDDSYFDNVGFGKGWSLDYESSWFAAPSGSLSFDDNLTEIRIEPSEINFPAKITVVPETNFVTIIPKVITADESAESDVKVTRVRGTNLITASGQIAKGSKAIIEHVSISNPAMYFLTVLREVLEKRGIIIRGKVARLDDAGKNVDQNNLIPIFKHHSVPLRLIIREMNKNSNNFYAEQILKTIGMEEKDLGTVDNGVKACKNLFNDMGINSESMVMADGSGLSRLNLVTPRQIINLLAYMYKNEEFEKYYESLPIAGIDGTMADRMKRTVAEGNVHAKPGFNEFVSALSGYLRTTSGEPLVFSMIVNNYLTPPALANYIHDSVCQRLINFNRN
ncbi:MAG: D-alanyl-D-alaninecarboxypeptidase/D-alanyl-D-al anine-endopeptidase [Stygiobacter sp.]|nr:MAG: D-alanyl-D-alaninecarboxypeptidase/D-alanyl-D-al anine-endopeptidase [Stygiobacter sp.]KAF0210350.1 MAG: D-alanyl-D-alaninecarboxypeptidase/D-alanyl-D-al [Ignavibacteria bacterium]